MSTQEHKEMVDRIVYGLEIAERRMLEEKARNGECVIVSDSNGIIHHVPASQYLKVK
ncbi:MAG: hypothetical protein IJ533_04475 [Prevotella sp.]|nr:hypothetical protein [Prevotella sp.]